MNLSDSIFKTKLSHENLRRFIACPFVVDEVSSGCPSGTDGLQLKSYISRSVAQKYMHTIIGTPINCASGADYMFGVKAQEYFQEHALENCIGFTSEAELCSDGRFLISGFIWPINFHRQRLEQAIAKFKKEGFPIGVSCEFFKLEYTKTVYDGASFMHTGSEVQNQINMQTKDFSKSDDIRFAQSFTITGASVLINPAYKQSFFQLV